MTTGQASELPSPSQEPFRWERSQAVGWLDEALHDPDRPSLRVFAAEHEIPPSTLHYWKRRQDHIDAPDPLRQFYESPAGLAHLRRQVLAAYLDFQQPGGVGIRPLMSFFEHCGLAPFLACSFGAQHNLASAVQSLIIQYEQEQRAKLAALMPARKISLCEDETYLLSFPCLVAIEPVSDFIVVECYQPHRDAATWDRVIVQGLQGLPVEVNQVSSDEAKGIKAHVKDGLGAHHSPDLMHLQQDLHQATSLPLQAQVKWAQEYAIQAEYQAFLAVYHQREYENGPPRPGRPPDFAARVEPAKEHMHQAQQELVACQHSQQQVKQAIRGLGDDYHPFDATKAQAVQPETLQERLHERLVVIQEGADAAAVNDKGQQKINRVRKLLPRLVATLAWFWLQVAQLLAQKKWTEGQKELFKHKVLAWVYWQQASKRGRDAEHRQQLRELVQRCGEAVEADPLWKEMSEEQRQEMLQLAAECAGRWVRSSSCVEGRNGVLRLRHHGRQGLNGKALTVLTVLHNYAIRRADGTTAAERFFGHKPDDLFEWLLDRLPELPRPAKSRKHAA
jgi:hypothetical protein